MQKPPEALCDNLFRRFTVPFSLAHAYAQNARTMPAPETTAPPVKPPSATPKTQSILLEAMEERQVTAEGETRRLPEPFFVIATQNPSYQVGTFPLPESQLDRFLMRIELGYPDPAATYRPAPGCADPSGSRQLRRIALWPGR